MAKKKKISIYNWKEQEKAVEDFKSSFMADYIEGTGRLTDIIAPISRKILKNTKKYCRSSFSFRDKTNGVMITVSLKSMAFNQKTGRAIASARVVATCEWDDGTAHNTLGNATTEYLYSYSSQSKVSLSDAIDDIFDKFAYSIEDEYRKILKERYGEGVEFVADL